MLHEITTVVSSWFEFSLNGDRFGFYITFHMDYIKKVQKRQYKSYSSL